MNNFWWLNGKPISWQKVKVLTSRQNATKFGSFENHSAQLFAVFCERRYNMRSLVVSVSQLESAEVSPKLGKGTLNPSPSGLTRPKAQSLSLTPVGQDRCSPTEGSLRCGSQSNQTDEFRLMWHFSEPGLQVLQTKNWRPVVPSRELLSCLLGRLAASRWCSEMWRLGC